MIGARVSRDTAAWLRAETVKRIPAGGLFFYQTYFRGVIWASFLGKQLDSP